MNRKITFGFTGDFCLSRAHETPGYLEKTYDFCRSCNESVDLAFTNFEFCITPPGLKVDSMALPSDFAGGLYAAEFDIYCLANNHIKDYGDDVMVFTKNFLEQQGQYTVGAGRNLEEATLPLYLEKNGFKIAIINVCDATHYAAENNTAGIAPLKKKTLVQAVSQANEKADIVIVCIHADLEFTNSPAPWRVKLSRQIADMGANIIIQHHPHTLQGIEYWGNTLIAYSLGNFVFPLKKNSYAKNRDGYVNQGAYLEVFLEEQADGFYKIIHSVKPTVIGSEDNPLVASGNTNTKIIQNIDNYCDILNNSRALKDQYFQLCRNQMKSFLMGIYYRVAKKEFKAAFFYIHHHLKTKAHTAWIKGFFTFGCY
ncbi:MAG: CapA family protein [Kiritimatiellae bacterium]|jgi:hypothetical protein|nr:CapA family protein [Kiritimatiellia bacterium]